MSSRALILRPALLVADDPVSMIDASLRASIGNLLRGLRERRDVSIIYITARSVLDDPQHPYSKLLKSSALSPEVPPTGVAFHA